MTANPPRGRTQFLLLAALFFAPLLAAVLLYFQFPELAPSGRVNKGQLIDPARPMPEQDARLESGAPAGEAPFRGHWSYVYVAPSTCDADCTAKLYQIRQIRTLLNEKRLRVRRIYLAPTVEAAVAAQAQLQEEHQDLVFLADTSDGAFRRFFDLGDAQALYLLDPLGNWLMWYAGDADSRDILKDIKRLLRISQIG